MTEGDDYREAREAAFQRDNHTCQLCGMVGYPKSERGLAAVPVEPDEYHISNLVTVCHSCLKKDDQRLHSEVAEVAERRERRPYRGEVSPDQEEKTTTEPDGRDTGRSTESTRANAVWNSTVGRILATRRAERQSDSSDRYERVDIVGERDNFNCQVCGAVTLPPGRVGYLMYNLQSADGDSDIDDYATVCWDCFEWKDEREIDRKARKSLQAKTVSREFSLRYATAVVRDLTEKTRLFVHTGRLVVLRRLVAATVALACLLALGVLFAGMVGALFVSPEAGIEWGTATLSLYQGGWAVLRANPEAALSVLAVGYLAHVVERERAYRRERFRNRRRRGETPTISYARPRWQFVAGFAVVGLVGAVDWLLVSHGVFPAGMLFGAVVFWLVGSVGVAYYLRYALREDRDVDGQPVTPAPWVFAARVSLFIGILGIVGTVSTTDLSLSPLLVELAALTTPVVGLGYVARRYIERRTQWGAHLLQSFRTVLGRIGPWDEQWPPAAERHRPSATESSRHDNSSNDSNE